MKTYDIIKVNVIENIGFEEDSHSDDIEYDGYTNINDANRECVKLNYYARNDTIYFYVKENESQEYNGSEND